MRVAEVVERPIGLVVVVGNDRCTGVAGQNFVPNCSFADRIGFVDCTAGSLHSVGIASEDMLLVLGGLTSTLLILIMLTLLVNHLDLEATSLLRKDRC